MRRLFRGNANAAGGRSCVTHVGAARPVVYSEHGLRHADSGDDLGELSTLPSSSPAVSIASRWSRRTPGSSRTGRGRTRARCLVRALRNWVRWIVVPLRIASGKFRLCEHEELFTGDADARLQHLAY